MARFTATTGPPIKTGDPRQTDPRWIKARADAERLAAEHFRMRSDATAPIVQAFIHRETLRNLGEQPVRVMYGWGRPVRGVVLPDIPDELIHQLDAKRRREMRGRKMPAPSDDHV
jgi:hypothetical protein